MSTFEYLSMRCDECGRASFINCPNHTRLTKRMTDAGWYVDGFQDLCPECRPQVEDTVNGAAIKATTKGEDNE